MSGGRLIPARSSTKSSVASPLCTWCSNSSSRRSKRSRRCSISVTSWPMRISERATFAPTLPPPATRTYISRTSRRGTSQVRTVSVSTSIAVWSGTRCACRGRHRTRRAPDRAARTTTQPMSKRFCATWPITMFVLSPSVDATTASASSIPASRSRPVSMPWPTTNAPRQDSPRRERASSFSSTTTTSQPSLWSWSAMVEPTRPQPMTRLSCERSVARAGWSRT